MPSLIKPFLAALAFWGAMAAFSVSAQIPQVDQSRSGLMSPAQMLAAAQAVPNKKTRVPLAAWVRACSTQRWGQCHVQWWNLIQDGGLIQIEQEGFSGWGFIGQPAANRVLVHMTAALDHPNYRARWDLDLKTYGEAGGLPVIIDGRSALTNGADHALVLSMLEHNLRHFNISYDMYQEMATPAAEWLRLLAMMLASQGDAVASNEVLHHLHGYAKGNAQEAAVYNATVQAAKNLARKIKSVRR